MASPNLVAASLAALLLVAPISGYAAISKETFPIIVVPSGNIITLAKVIAKGGLSKSFRGVAKGPRSPNSPPALRPRPKKWSPGPAWTSPAPGGGGVKPPPPRTPASRPPPPPNGGLKKIFNGAAKKK